MESGRAYTPKPTRDYVDALRAQAIAAWGDRSPLKGPLRVKIVALLPLPKTAKGRTHHTQRPDLDNLCKAAIDALLPQEKKVRGERVKLWGGVFDDDSQITSLRADKQWAVDGGLLIQIWSLA